MWGSNPLHAVIFTEPDFPYTEALAPFQPLAMKAFHCPIDTSLNFSQANKLIKDLRPQALVAPEQYVVPSSNAPPKSTLVIEDRPVLSFKRGNEVRLPLKRRKDRVFMAPEVAASLSPQELRPGLHAATITALLTIRDNQHHIMPLDAESTSHSLDSKLVAPSMENVLKGVQYEWSNLEVDEFVRKLAQEGITDAKVERGPNGCIIHLQREDTLIQVDGLSTHILSTDPNLRLKLREILLKCLPRF